MGRHRGTNLFIGYNCDDGYHLRWGRVLVAGALAVTATVASCASCNNYEYSHGTRTGVINKFSEKGFIWKTYEGQMALEGLVGGQTTAANVWNFSIDNEAKPRKKVEDLTKKLNEALDSGTKVKVKYIEAGFPWFSRGETSYYIQSVEPAKKE